MKNGYVVIREFCYASSGNFEVQSLPKIFTTEKRASEYAKMFIDELIGGRIVKDTNIVDNFGNKWDRSILIETGSLSYYRIRIQKVIINQ